MSTRGMPRLDRLRADEDSALTAWRRACASFEEALAHRDSAVARSQASVERAMRPLTQRAYERLERADAKGDVVTLARYARRLGDIRHYLDVVRPARDRLAAVIVARDKEIDATRCAVAAAARALLALPPLPVDVVGVTRQQLGTYARDRAGGRSGAGRCQRRQGGTATRYPAYW